MAHPDAALYARWAGEQLRRTLRKLYTYESLGTATPSVCPDPRRIFLPPGAYVMRTTAGGDFAQRFEVVEPKNAFILDVFATTRDESGEGAHVYAASWYRKPCIGKRCHSTPSRSDPGEAAD